VIYIFAICSDQIRLLPAKLEGPDCVDEGENIFCAIARFYHLFYVVDKQEASISIHQGPPRLSQLGLKVRSTVPLR